MKNEDKLEETLIDVSDPKSKNWVNTGRATRSRHFLDPVDGALENLQEFLRDQEDVKLQGLCLYEFVTATALSKGLGRRFFHRIYGIESICSLFGPLR